MTEFEVLEQKGSKVGSWSFDFSKKLFFATNETYLIFGRSQNEFDGSLDNVLKFVVEEDRETFAKGMEAAFRGTPLNVKFQILTSKGELKLIHARAEMFYHADKSPDVMIGTVQDITEQLLLERNIENLQVTINQDNLKLQSSQFYYNNTTKKIIIGEEIYNLFNISRDNFDGTTGSLFEIVHVEDQKMLKDVFQDPQVNNHFDIVFRVVRDQNTIRYVHSEGDIRVEMGEMKSISGILEDFTKFEHFKLETKQKLEEIQRVQTSFLVGSWELDFATNAFNWSDVTFQIYGLDPALGAPAFETFIGKVHPDDRDIVLDLLNNLPEESPFEVEFRIIRDEGETRNIKHLVEVTRNAEGQPKSIRGNIQDITHQKEMESKINTSLNALSQLRKRFDLVIDNSKDVFEIVDENGLIKYISPAVESMMGAMSSEFEGRYIWDFFDEREKASLRALFNQCIGNSHKNYIGNAHTTKNNGEEIYFEVTMRNHLLDPEVNGIVLNWKDITSKILLDNKVHQLSNYDELTGLPNRTFFKDTIENNVYLYTLQLGKFAVFMIDIDEFKGINNVLSFEFGDNMIKKVGKAIKEAMSDREIFLARFYGDQFGLIVEKIGGVQEGQIIAERLLEVFAKSFVIEPYELYVTANIGFSIFPDDSTDSSTLVKFANVALSRAKDMGKLKYQAYSPLLDIKSFKDFSLRNDLKKAIENHELEVYFQPIVDLKTGEIIAGEALSRWNHPEWGMVPPSEFIPIAESTGLIIPLGKWLLDDVCRLYKSWIKKGHKKIKISVNYSVLQFYEVNFVNQILETISKHRLSPDFMIFEITESVLINQGKQTEKDLSDLKTHGIQIAIDDFGTGYSSLAYLSSMNMDVLKIDRSFIDDLSKRDKSAKILIAIINLAKDLNMKIVAEGVSEWPHLNFLRHNNCYAGQGYLFSRPLKSHDFEICLTKGYIEPEPEQIMEIKLEDEQRHAERIELTRKIEAEMTIVEIKSKPVKVGYTKAQIKDLGLSGMSFMTNVKFPVKNDILLQFNFDVNGHRAEVHGAIVWTEEVEPGKHLFGFEFIEDEQNMVQVKKIVQTLVSKDGEAAEPDNTLLEDTAQEDTAQEDTAQEDTTQDESTKGEAMLDEAMLDETTLDDLKLDSLKRDNTKPNKIYELIEKSGKLPEIPPGLYEILELLSSPTEVNIEELALKVSAYEALNQLLLENINSGYFKISKKVYTLEEAIILLGMKTVLNLIVFFVTKLLFDLDLERKSRKFDIYHYWRHVLGTSVAAQMISQHLKKGDKHMLLTYGLIHDIGIPVLDNCLPEHLDRIAEKVKGGMHQIVAEKIILGGLTHSDIGAWLCEKWHFSADIKEIVLNHHTPLLSTYNSVDTMIVYVADVMSTDNNERLLGMTLNLEVSEKVLEMLGMTKAAYDEIASRLSQEIEKVGTYFLL